MFAETPLEFYERTAKEAGISLEKLVKKVLITSIRETKEIRGNKIVLFGYCTTQKLFYSNLYDDKELIAGIQYKIDENKINERNLSNDITMLTGLVDEIQEEFLFTLTGKNSGIAHIRVKNNTIVTSQPYFKGCTQEIFNKGLDYQPALKEMIYTYLKKE